MKQLFLPTLLGAALLSASCGTSKKTSTSLVTKGQVNYWTTTADQNKLLAPGTPLTFGANNSALPTIAIDSMSVFQGIDGFGYTLTGGSAVMLNQMSKEARKALLQELFGNGKNDIGISYLRVSIGASDLNESAWSYDDIPAGQEDLKLEKFTLALDQAGGKGTGLIPLLKEILAINPNIPILGSPWSPPAWMKDNGATKGGKLLPKYYDVYARYFVKYIQEMKKEGITIDAITIQNEPLHPGNNPSLLMVAEDQRDFVKQALGPVFKQNNIKTKIIIYDHNLDKPEYPMTILADPEAAKYVDGSAFHLYAGKIDVMSKVHEAYPQKNLYFTEQWTGKRTSFRDDLLWHTKNVVIGAMRNWSRNSLAWNLANDTAYKPHTPGGCTECKGALTINNDVVMRNVAYYTVAHASKFIPVGSKRIASNNEGTITTAAFLTPKGDKVLIVCNDAKEAKQFNVKTNSQTFTSTIPAESVITYTW
ncbi:glucosylceramidase [Chitinophaga skermanii]|uniref:Glucosylceramidase n=1 Tax=Chitinophaga skermanii TaxID=331697 RepID=A0A327R106_9BACT|nr:glycoside hydrolase family 30 beta sandwich domain-containing protein [Chitinophaga skermanii]RAJ10566.1 glucosylceramidase [Chitinophaga skermanii]